MPQKSSRALDGRDEPDEPAGVPDAGFPEADDHGADGVGGVDDAGGVGSFGEADGVDEEVSAFIERFAGQLSEAGMPRMPSRVFAALLASPDGALSSAALSEWLRISPAAVSGAVRYLAQTGMIVRERDPGSRRELYRLHNDQWFETFTNREHMLVRWENTLRTGVGSLGEDSSAGRRLAETADFFAFLHDEYAALMDRWRARRTAP